ncbi:hypothetical protein RB195_023486 [Necator americanus]|uniref:Reverse transcriptase domain-containing protein n=1 Tax=Necator americanus TaxID=51031 RepID=A0ABR1EK96_NECAM
MESLATTIRFVTLNCRTLSSEHKQATLGRLLQYFCVPFAALQETRIRDRPVVSIENYTIYCGDADENKRTSDNGDRLVDLCEQTGFIIASASFHVYEESSTPSAHVAETRKKLCEKQIQDAAKKTHPVIEPKKKLAFASAKTKSTCNSVYVARSTGDFNQEKRLRRKLHRQLQEDHDKDGKMRRCSPVLNAANGVAIGEATLPIWREHFKTLLSRQAPSAPELEYVHRPKYVVNEEPPIESKVLVAHSAFLDRLIKHREETTRDEQAGFRPGRSTIDQVFIVRRNLAAVFKANAVVIGVRQGAMAGPFLFTFATDDIMRRTVDQCPADIVLAP